MYDNRLTLSKITNIYIFQNIFSKGQAPETYKGTIKAKNGENIPISIQLALYESRGNWLIGGSQRFVLGYAAKSEFSKQQVNSLFGKSKLTDAYIVSFGIMDGNKPNWQGGTNSGIMLVVPTTSNRNFEKIINYQ